MLILFRVLFAASTATVLLAAGVSDHEDIKANNPGLRGLQDMGAVWRIGAEPTFNWDKDNKEFQLGWEISDAIQDFQFDYKIFDNWECNTKNGGNDITVSSNDPAGNSYYLYTAGLKAHEFTPYQAASNGSGTRQTFLHLALQTLKIPNMSIWDPDTDQVKFCVRFMLHTDATKAIEVNYQEVQVLLDVDLTNDFDVSVEVIPRDKTEEQDSVKCNVDAYICNQDNELDAEGILLNQGDEIRVCVKTAQSSRDNGLWLEKINYFYFYRDFPGLPQVSQDAIVEGGIQSPTGLTSYGCQPGEDPCGFDSILVANFYSTPGVGVVNGRGEAICQFGRDNVDTQPPSAAPNADDIDETAVPSLSPTIAATGTPTVFVEPWFGVPTNEPNGDEEECLTDPFVIEVSDWSYMTLLDQSFKTTPLNDENTAVNVTLTQNFAKQFDNQADQNLHWLGMIYPSLSTGSNTCRTSSLGEDIGWGDKGDVMTVSALCNEKMADPVRLYVQLDLYMQDGDLPFISNDIDVPDQCGDYEVEDYNKKNLAFTVFVPCGVCATRRHLRRALHRHGYISKAELQAEVPLPMDNGRLLKKMGKRELQDAPPPSPPFDLSFEIDGTPDGFRASSAQSTGGWMMALTTMLSLLWGAATMFAF